MKNRDDLKVMLRETGILFAITLIAGLVLGFVYQLTKEPIRQQQEKKIREACQAVFEDAAAFETLDAVPTVMQQEAYAENGVKVGQIYEALDAAGNVLGNVIAVTSTEGYGGNIDLYMGVRNDGTLNGISILKISETPGLGMEAENVLVPQFADKKVTSFTYTKTGRENDTQIDAISGATITTKAVTNAVNTGLSFFADTLQKGGNDHE